MLHQSRCDQIKYTIYVTNICQWITSKAFQFCVFCSNEDKNSINVSFQGPDVTIILNITVLDAFLNCSRVISMIS